MARELLGRELEDAVVDQVARRLSGLLERVRAMDEHGLIGLEPSGAFAAGHPAWSRQRSGPEAWTGLGPATPGSSGYAPSPGSGPAPQAVSDAAGRATAAATTPSATLDPATAELLYMPASLAAARIRRRELSPVELMHAVLRRITALNPVLNSFITVTAEAALARAEKAETEVMRASNGSTTLGPLHGVPVAVKDLFFTAGVRTTGGSKVLSDWVPDIDATAVARLQAAGAILVGKTHTHEFAYGATSYNEHYGAARNPWDPTRIPGGSSGGSAAAVAAGMAHLALGSDTAGSIRIPAAACGVVGLKPTYGRVSKAGVLPLSWSLDTVGPITRNVADAGLMLAVLAGPDPADHTAVPLPVGDYAAAAQPQAGGLKGLRVGVARSWLEDRVEPEVAAACLQAVAVLAGLGAQVQDVPVPAPDQMLLVNRLITLAEASSYHTPYLQSRPRDYSSDVRLRLELGQFMLARDYIAGQRLRGELCQHFARLMTDIDILVMPTLPLRAAPIGQDALDWDGVPDTVLEAMIRLTSPMNVTGQPAISMPSGFPGGLPVAVQFAGRPFAEEQVLQVAAAYEAATPWQHRRPPL